MSFQKYSSLENHTNGKFLTKVFHHLDVNGLRNTDFVARSKLHGTNFSVIITKDSIIPAKRTDVIGETEKFFGYEDLMKKYKDNFKLIQEEEFLEDGVKTIQIFGEYAGGNIQKEVDYGEKDFYVFDIMIDGNYFPDNVVTSMCCNYGLKMCPLIGKGTLDELLKLPVEYESVVGLYNSVFDTGIIIANTSTFIQNEPNGNTEEGLVIKPIQPMFLPSGSRIAIKYKTDAFKEKGKGQSPKIPVPLTDNDKELLLKFSEYATTNRVRNVASHLGELVAKDFGKVLGLTMRDIFVEAEREGLTIDGAEMPSKLKGELQKIVQSTIQEIWIDLINP